MRGGDNLTRIASFSVDHDKIGVGMYVSRIDGDITTYDLRTRVPNGGDYMDNVTMHSVEHLMATYLRSGPLKDRIIYFGPMGCRTGFYLLVRGADNAETLNELKRALRDVCENARQMPGATRVECGNYLELDLECGRAECRRYLEALDGKKINFKYY